jgi:hypothetical protein
LGLFEEKSGSKISKWLFIGDTENWENPLFELVLNSKITPSLKAWIPHFQIDLDTNLSTEELETLVQKHFGYKFFSWKLNIPNYGVVLAMGMLEEINGMKVYLGLGTNLRNTKYHRENILKLLN